MDKNDKMINKWLYREKLKNDSYCNNNRKCIIGENLYKKTAKLFGAVVILCLLLGTQAFAYEKKAEMSNGYMGFPILSAEMEDRASGYRCLNSSCYAYLEKRNILTKCGFCTSTMYAYECRSCGNWYPICGNGHYNTAVGR